MTKEPTESGKPKAESGDVASAARVIARRNGITVAAAADLVRRMKPTEVAELAAAYVKPKPAKPLGLVGKTK
ncbi:MAG: hypothetical protein GY838_03925 [bacterium]|nr:hypothetical protein [bacterium]